MVGSLYWRSLLYLFRSSSFVLRTDIWSMLGTCSDGKEQLGRRWENSLKIYMKITSKVLLSIPLIWVVKRSELVCIENVADCFPSLYSCLYCCSLTSWSKQNRTEVTSYMWCMNLCTWSTSHRWMDREITVCIVSLSVHTR